MVLEKCKKGYVVVSLGKETRGDNIFSTAEADAIDIIKLIDVEARSSVTDFFSGSLSTMSQTQVDMAKSLILSASHLVDYVKDGEYHNLVKKDMYELIEYVQQYYQTIPTHLGSKINTDELVLDWVKLVSSGVLEDRLRQLESQIVSAQTIQSPEILNIKLVDTDSDVYKRICEYVNRTHHAKIVNIYSIKIVSERERCDAETIGKGNIMSVFHGTNSANIKHILKDGLVIPQYNRQVLNGTRLGKAVYGSDSFSRSNSYSNISSNRNCMMLMCDFALGKPYVTSGTDSNLTFTNLQRRGYDSAHGTNSNSGLGDEYTVYRTSQQTVRALVVYEK